MVKSMTGFGRGESQEDGKSFVVEIKTVNHRYSDTFIKMPRHLAFMEDKVREFVLKGISRGKIDVFVSYEDKGADSKIVTVDDALADAYIKALIQIRDSRQLKDDITVSLVGRFPDVLKVEKAQEDEEKLWQILSRALKDAVDSLVKMRCSEGQELKNNLLERASYIEGVIGDISLRAPEVVKEYKQKLGNRIKELLEQQTVDEGRMAVEVALFADRCSIDEELVRLSSHLVQLRETLEIQQPVGRKLDFLVQEMNREINTIGSKANDLVITKNVVELKSEIEKIREQIQNIE